MNIAVISFKDVDVTLGIQELIQTYGEDKPIFFLPLTKSYNLFTQSVIDTCRSNGVEVHCFFPNANGFEDLLTQADDIILTDNPVKEVLRQLTTNDSLGIVWDDSPQAHFALHSVEDLAIDVWDITDGLDPIELEPDAYEGMDSRDLHDAMHKHLGMFIDLMAAFVAETVMDSLSEAVAQHIIEAETKRDVSPFKDEDLD
jgi:hypothetical protein